MKQEELRNGLAGEGQGLSEEDGLRINEYAEDVNCGRIELVESHAVLPRLQHRAQDPQGPVIRWERFLPLRSLKVLLVENDDSTRHVVSALLRNCSYEVTAVANGLEAWKILEDLTSHIDLVLMEVVMPCLSGIGLLCKIMSHKTRKNIPVIMMSTTDSVSIVVKCLSKGAVDFLLKPIRKNELKNLWRHVWRKCNNQSSGSGGSESGIHAQNSMKSKSDEGSDNNTGSNDADDNGSIGLNRDGSDNGSDTQNSWTKRAVEVDSPKPMSSWDQLADPPDSTSAQVIHSKAEVFCNNLVPTNATRECHEQDDELENVMMGKDLEIGVPKNTDLQLEDPSNKVLTSVAGTHKETFSDLDPKKDCEKLEKGEGELNKDTSNGALMNEAADLMGAITNSTNPQMESMAFEIPMDFSKITNIKDKAIHDAKKIPSLELSLKRRRDAGDTGTNLQQRNILRQSDVSAFSRYNTTSTAYRAPTENVGSCSPLDNSSEAAKTQSIHNLQSNSNGAPNQNSNVSSNNNDMGSTTNNVFTKPAAFTDKPMPKSAVSIHPCSAFQPVQSGHMSSLQPVISGKADPATVDRDLTHARGMHRQVQFQHNHHHYHHHHYLVHNMQQQQQQQSNHDDLSSRNMVAAPHFGPSNVSSTPIEGNAANYGSASGSDNGQNGGSDQNGSSTAVFAEGTNMESDNGMARKFAFYGGNGSGSRSEVPQNRLAHREAALNKFRQKRKERCFGKKVRYQNRKRLAEQRPRVRGQFVRQAVQENKSKDTYC